MMNNKSNMGYSHTNFPSYIYPWCTGSMCRHFDKENMQRDLNTLEKIKLYFSLLWQYKVNKCNNNPTENGTVHSI